MRLLGNVRYQIALILLIAIVPLALLAVYVAVEDGNNDARRAQADSHETVRLVARDLNKVIESSSALVRGLSKYSRIRDNPESCNTELTALQPALPQVSNMFVLDSDGTVLCAASNPLHIRSLGIRPDTGAFIDRVRRTKRTVVGNFVRTYPGKRVLPVGGPILDGEGRLQSIFIVSIDLDWIEQQVSSVQLPPDATLLVMDGQGKELARNPPSKDWPAGTPAPDLERTLVGKSDFDAELKGYDGVHRFYSVARVRDGENLLVMMKIRSNAIYRPARRRLAMHLGGLGAVGLLVLSLTWFGSDRYFRRPLSSLIDAANRLASGNLTARSGLSHSGELGVLAHSFDQMAESLERNQAAEKETAAREAARLRRLKKLSELSMMLAGDPTTVFERIVRMIGELFEARAVCLSEVVGPNSVFRAVYAGGEFIPNAGDCPTAITPCATVIESRNIRIYENVIDLFPQAEFLRLHNAYTWCGFPSLDNTGKVVAVTCLVDDKPRELSEEDRQILWVIGQRIAAELELSRSMAEHARMEEALRENESRLQEAQRMARVGSYAGDGVTTSMEWSDEMYRIFEVDPAQGVPGMDIVLARAHPDDRALVQATKGKLFTNSTCEVSHRLLMPDGRIKHVQVKVTATPQSGGAPLVRGTVQDVTEQKHAEEEKVKLQAQLNQAQKMESIGRLAGGIAHDFNNLLTVINGYSNVLIHQLEQPSRKYVEQIQKAGESGASLIRQLLAFSRKETANPRPILLNELVRESREMLDRLVGDDTEITTELGASPDEVLADPNQIQQCLMNLVVNARDAMPGGGLLTIETASARVGLQDLPAGSSAEPGSFVLLKIRDNGIGMDEETSQRIFEPFFTTKEKGRGTGLGLSTVYGIVNQWKGFIKVASQLGKGTEFSICLPLSIGQHLKPDAAPVENAENAGAGTVLVVEDQDIVREFVVESLRMSGWTVLEARSGIEALQLVNERHGNIELVISDMMMPGMRGEELAARVRTLCPSIRILFMTGYTDGSIINHNGLDVRDEVIMKPFAPEELEARVNNLLRGRQLQHS